MMTPPDQSPPELTRAARRRHRGWPPWSWVVLALATFVLANVISVAIACAHPPLILR